MELSGLDAQFGWAAETTVGTYVAPTRFQEFLDESLKFTQDTIKSKGMSPGRKTVSRWVDGLRQAQGDIEYEVMPAGFGAVPQYLIGGAPVTTTPTGATTTRLHTTSAGSLDGKSRTIQMGRPNNAGAVDPFSYLGCKVTDWTLTMEAGKDGFLTMKETIDALDRVTSNSLATASYATTNWPIAWSGTISITIGGTAYNINKLTLGGTNNLSTARTKLGSMVRLEQTEGDDFRAYPISFDVESYAGLATGAQSLIQNGTEAAIVATFASPVVLEAALSPMVRVTLARCIFEGDDPVVGGPGLVGQSITGEALYAGSGNADIKFEVQNSDSTP